MKTQLNVRKDTEPIRIVYHTDTAVIKVPQMTGARLKTLIMTSIRAQLKVSPLKRKQTISAIKIIFDQLISSQISSLFPLSSPSNPALK